MSSDVVQTVGHYRILERLGAGGMGIVYKAEDTKLGRIVALKFLPPELTRDPQAKARFLREARAASALDHQGICTIFDIGDTDDEQTYLAMAFYEGETLKAKIEKGPMPVDEALAIAVQMGRGLAHAHAAGVVHRDIKPANVVVTNDGVAKILDFGLAKLSGATAITRSNRILGTLFYMAPEQLRGEEVGPPADLWALGAVLFEMLAGRRAFSGDNDQAMIYSIQHAQPLSLLALRPDVPAGLEPIVRKLLRKDPLQRIQTANEAVAELDALRVPSSGSGRAERGVKPRENLRPGARLGPYEIVEQVGSGGMGDVYRARDTRLDRLVAIKVLAPDFSEDAERKQRFQREAKTISSLSHPNICTLFDVGEQEGTDYLVMEYVEGETLADRLARGALPLNELLKFGIQIAEALGRAHQQGIVHRDLKPGNVMLTKSGAVKLVDFGLAKDIGAVTSVPRRAQTEGKPLTAEGSIVGTLTYMAPEQIEGREADVRSDIFALGAILYEMATGRRAFEGATNASLIVSILEKQPALLAETRGANESSSRGVRSLAAIEHVVGQCLEKDPEQRWQNALDVASELRWVAEHGVVAELRTGRTARTAFAWKLACALLALLLVAAVAAVWKASRGRDRTQLADVVRLEMSAPPELQPGSVRLSPDGAAIVVRAQTRTAAGAQPSPVRLFLRRLDSDDFVALPGTDHADGYWFSFDGRSVLFVAPTLIGSPDLSLYRVRLDGTGPPVRICPWEENWNNLTVLSNEDYVVAVEGTKKSFVRIPADGRAPSVPTKIDFGDLKMANFAFALRALPGDEGILTYGESYSETGIHCPVGVLDLRTAKVRHLIDDGYYPHYLSSGYLVFGFAGALRAIGFDPASMTLSGRPMVVTTGLAGNPWRPEFFDLSTNGTLVYERGEMREDRRNIGFVSQSGTVSVPRERLGFYLEIDGGAVGRDRIVYTVVNGRQLNELWLWEMGQPSPRLVVSLPGADIFNPRLSRDGNRVAFYRFGLDKADGIYVKELDREEPPHSIMTLGPPHGSSIWRGRREPEICDWAPDGAHLLVARKSEASGMDLVRLPVQQPMRSLSELEPIVSGAGDQTSARVSPDGKWMVWTSTESGGPELHIGSFGADGNVSGNRQITTSGGLYAWWEPNGHQLRYFLKGEVWSLPITTTPVLTVGSPAFLYDARKLNLWVFDVLSDGRQLAIVHEKPKEPEIAPRWSVVVNWSKELADKMSGAK